MNHFVINKTADVFPKIQNILLCLYVFSISIENIQPFGADNFSITKFFAALYLLSITANFKTYFELDRSLYFFWPIAFFYIWLSFISLVNINPYSAKFFAADIFFNIIVFIVIINHARKDYNVLDKAMFLFAMGTVIISVLLFSGIGKEVNYDCRATFLGADLNELGLKLTTGLIILLTGTIQDFLSIGKKRYLLIIFIPLILLSILETGSRTAYLVLLISGSLWCYIAVFVDKSKSARILAASFVIIFVFCLLWSYTSQCNIVVSRFSSNSDVGYLNLGGRDVLWREFFVIALKNLVFGYGLSGFEYQSMQHFGTIQSPHNIIIEILLYAGLIGLAIYVLFIYRIVMSSYYHLKEMNKYLPMLMLPTFAGFALSLQALSEKICWVILAYAVGNCLRKSGAYMTANCSDQKKLLNE